MYNLGLKIMKNSIIICLLFLGITACNEGEKENQKKDLVENTVTQEVFQSFGEEITPENTLNANEMQAKFENLKPGDTIETKFKTTVNSVCKMKGCWMTLVLPDGENSTIKFKDYAFFVPKDIEGKTVIVAGKAFIDEVSVEDQKHFAEDGGQSKAEIEAIKEPKKTRSLLAHGVLLKN